MKTTLYSLLFLIGSLFLFTQCEKETDSLDQELQSNKKSVEIATCSIEQELWAGAGKNDLNKGTLVGSVEASFLDMNTLMVTYHMNAFWDLTEAHVWVGNDLYSIPKKAAPGRFPFAKYSEPYSFEINLEDNSIDPAMSIFLAAHGVVCASDEFQLDNLPETVPFSVSYPGDRSYFKTSIVGESNLVGMYDGWCMETTQSITPGIDYIASVYSSLDKIPDDLVDFPENFDLINWVINQDFVGSPSSSCEGNYTWSDLQLAIWKLLLANPEPSGLGQYSSCRVDEIISLAEDNGEGFIPECGEKFAIILDNESVQNTFIEISVPCSGCETAWAFGEYTFMKEKISKKWGWISEIDCWN